METPSFEKPEIWATEIRALNSLSSGVDGDEREVLLDGLASGVKDVVRVASGGSSGSKPNKKVVGAKKGKKKVDVESDGEAEE